MKLNYKRVLLVGAAFFLITAFWQAYDAIIPLILIYPLLQKYFVKGIMVGAIKE